MDVEEYITKLLECNPHVRNEDEFRNRLQHFKNAVKNHFPH